MRDDLNISTKYWFSVEDLAERFHLAAKTVRALIKPYRGRCHLGRRGKHPRLVLWIPKEVVRILDKERRAVQIAPGENPVKTLST